MGGRRIYSGKTTKREKACLFCAVAKLVVLSIPFVGRLVFYSLKGWLKVYKFVETEKGCLVGGYTQLSIRSMQRHLSKVGKVQSLKGYTYFSTRNSGEDGAYTANHTAVAVIGDKGRIRLGGLCWGYQGEGPRGLQKLFDSLEIDKDASTVAPAPTNQESKVYWEIEVGKDDETKNGSLAFDIEFLVFDRSRHDSAKMSRQQVEQFADDESELQELRELLDGLGVGCQCDHPTQGLIITRTS